MLWKVTPDYADYDMYDEAIIKADSKEEAETIATQEFNCEYLGLKVNDSKQVWTAALIEVDKLEEGVILSSFNAG